MDPFDIQIDQRTDAVVARLSGSASNAQADRLRTTLAELAEEDETRVVVDMQELSFIASMSLAELLQLHLKLKQSGRRLRLSGATDPIADVFKKTRLVELFPLYPSIDEAITAG